MNTDDIKSEICSTYSKTGLFRGQIDTRGGIGVYV